MILKTSNIKSAKLRKGGVRVGGDSRARRCGSEIDRSGIDDVEINGGEIEVDEIGKKIQKLSKSKNLSKSKKTVRSSDFLTFGAKLAFTKLKQMFSKIPIFHHFDLEHHIRIETNISGYAIVGVFS